MWGKYRMRELLGVGAAVLSSAVGGSAVAVTRFAVGTTEPVTLGAIRFGIGVALLLPAALIARERFPPRSDLRAVVALGLLFFGVFPVLFNEALARTTAARGALALSMLPLLTMLVAAMLGAERMTWRKAAGVLVASAGVGFALLPGAGAPPPGALAGDGIMLAAALVMAFYNVWSRPLIRRSGPISFTAVAMLAGACALTGTAWLRGGHIALGELTDAQCAALIYLGIAGGAVAFFLWAVALARTTPTKVAISVTINPLVAALVGALLLSEAVSANLLIGLALVLAGICLAASGADAAIAPQQAARNRSA